MIIAFKIDWDRVFGMKQDLVVLPEWHVIIIFNRGRNGHDPTGDCRDFRIIGERNSTFGLPFWFVFANQNAVADGLDIFERWAGHNAR